MMLRDNEITRMRSEIDRAMPDTATVLAVTRTSDGRGGYTESESTALTTACRLNKATSSTGLSMVAQALGAKVQNREVFFLDVPAGTEIEVGDRIEVNGYQYEALRVLDGVSWELERRVVVIRSGEAT